MPLRLVLIGLTAVLIAACSATQYAVPTSTASAATTPAPQVTCEANSADCAAETRAVLDAVASVGHPVVRVAFQADAMCIWYPFLGGVHSCPAIIEPDGTRRMTSAVVTFADTDQQGFLNVAWLADGSLSTTLALVGPPPGATPFQVGAPSP